jgi:hypothetical protein
MKWSTCKESHYFPKAILRGLRATPLPHSVSGLHVLHFINEFLYPTSISIILSNEKPPGLKPVESDPASKSDFVPGIFDD